MKIGILTLPLHTNYGGILQAWALQTVLEDMGHNVCVFGIKPEKSHSQLLMPLVWGKRTLKKMLTKDETPIFAEIRTKKKHSIKFSSIDRFISHRIKTKKIPALSKIKYEDFDTIVVGSDQIWRLEYIDWLWKTKKFEEAFLSFIDENKPKRIAYAASLGVADWNFNKETTSLIAKALNKFQAISVREISAVDILKESTNVNADFVCDPTMLLSAKEYIERLNINPDTNTGIISYILDPNDNTTELIKSVSKAHNAAITEINMPDKNGSYISVEEWVRKIASTKMVVTDSFHGCVFSIIFRKPLIFIGNTSRGNARFDSLIRTFGLHKNMLSDISEFDPSFSYNLPEDIDARIEKLRNYSYSFIKNNLNA